MSDLAGRYVPYREWTEMREQLGRMDERGKANAASIGDLKAGQAGLSDRMDALTARVEGMDGKLDVLVSKSDRTDGALSVVKVVVKWAWAPISALIGVWWAWGKDHFKFHP